VCVVLLIYTSGFPVDILNEMMSILTGDRSNESMEVDMDDTCSLPGDVTVYQPMSLLDHSSRVVAKTCSCGELDRQRPPLDEALLRKVGRPLTGDIVI